MCEADRAPYALLVSTPARSGDLLTAVFARMADARYAIGILESCGDGAVRTTVEEVVDDDGSPQLVVLRVEIGGIAMERVLAAISGGHGVRIEEPEEPVALIARIA